MTALRRAFALAAAAWLLGLSPLRWGGPVSAAAAFPEFLMPPDKAFIPSGPVIAAGRVPPGTAAVELLLDGAPLAGVTREGDTFAATLTPGPGTHRLEARAGGVSAAVAFTTGTGGKGAAPYRYHTPVLEGRCTECHAGVRRKVARAEARTCTVCHRRQAVHFPTVHEPVREGSCLACHDPHGSTRPAFITAEPRALCAECHGDPSAAHVEKGRSNTCYLCHNPHASMNPMLLYDIVK